MPFHADAEQLASFVREMQDKHDQIGRMITNAHNHATTLQGPAFQGSAGTAFQNTFDQFLTSANKMNEALMQNSQNLESAGKKYAEMEEGNLSTLQKTSDSLNWA
ncbi:WXG100 family type VII secretion target [Nocardia sp. NRRL WC-3656]|uniref:WXG100 family type VII secretion target n=1 Tax=Nocardia sp. NRRL WC-3656 TaxID=1463824 RepID=UPI000568CABC|nr:WXG100 family type VII secretion target [Nocardia sp. NRRL WC-3656]